MQIFKEKVNLVLVALTAALFIVSGIILFINIPRMVSPIILHFDSFNGADIFGNKSDLWMVWFAGIILSGFNIYLGEVLYRRERILSYVFVGSALLISLIVLLAAGVLTS